MSVSKIKTKDSAADHVVTYWGENAPDWVIELAKACDHDTQASVARKLGRSASLVNQVLKNSYTGDLNAVQRLVERALDVDAVTCPVLGSIKGDTCLRNQRKPYSPNNHMSVKLFRACRKCPHNVTLAGGSHDNQ